MTFTARFEICNKFGRFAILHSVRYELLMSDSKKTCKFVTGIPATVLTGLKPKKDGENDKSPQIANRWAVYSFDTPSVSTNAIAD